MKNNQIELKHEITDLANPQKVMEFGKLLAGFITANGLSVNIQGNQYAMVDGWKFAGANFGLVAISKEPVRLHKHGDMVHLLYAPQTISKGGKSWTKEVAVYASSHWNEDIFKELSKKHKTLREVHKDYFAFDCAVDIVNMKTEKIVGAGFSTCTSMEALKLGQDEYAIKSLAQTRAIGKGFRNLIGYIMKSAGFESTSAEEMYEYQTSESAMKEVKKPQMTDAKLKKAITLMKQGKMTIEMITEAFAVSDGQLAMLNAVKSKK